MITHFFSDPHFGHKNILQLAERPFRTIEEHDLTLATRYKQTVMAVMGFQHPIVVWCGDCFFGSSDLLRELPGTKILVRGNHDKGATNMARRGFDVVVDELRMCIDGTPVRVSHYPYAGTSYGIEDTRRDDRYLDRRPRRCRGEVLVHGHTHSRRQRQGNMIHVGVDAWDYRPVSILEVANLIRDCLAEVGGPP